MSDLKDFINVEAAVAAFGEPVYGFFRQYVAYSSGRKRGQGQHYVSCNSEQVSTSEYLENIEKSKENERSRFFSTSQNRFTRPYWRYEKRVITPGWPQAIKKMIEEMEKL